VSSGKCFFWRAALIGAAIVLPQLVAIAPGTASEGHGFRSYGAATKSSWYFAEGTTGYGFEEYICIQNPTQFDATVRATYMMPAEKVQVAGSPFGVPAYSRSTLNVADVTPGTDVSVRVDADQDVVCERSMYWGGRIEGHNSIGVTAPATRWYLAEGCTDYGFEEYVSIQNPGTESASVTFTYNTPAGPTKKPAFSVAARSRKTIKVNDDLAPTDVSVTVSATKPVVAERSMYWDGRRGGHDSIGTSYPSGQWFLAEGSTKWGFDSYVLVQNPSAHDAKVNMIFLTENGPKGAPQMLVKAGARRTVDARTIVGNADFSTSINSDIGIICERSMYWNNGTGKAGHDTIGIKEAMLNCQLAEGTTLYGFETFVLIANPNDAENSVIVTYMTPTGVEPGGEVVIPPYSRTTISVNADMPGRDVSIWLQGSLPIAAERSMYWNARGGGHDSIGYMSGPYSPP
jgi:hypothetical protein